jgi:hypothetical protein
VLCLAENLLYKVLADLPFTVAATGHEAEISKAINDWEKNSDGKSHLEGLVKLLGRDPTTELDSIRGQLESELEGHLGISSAARGAKFSPRQPTAGTEVGGLPGRGDVSGGAVELAASRRADTRDTQQAEETPLVGLPTEVKISGSAVSYRKFTV